MEDQVKRISVEYGIVAGTYLFLINSIINRVLAAQGQGTMMISLLIWFCVLLIVSFLLPYGVEDLSVIKDIKSFAKSSAFYFLIVFLFLLFLVGLGFLLIIGLGLFDVIVLILVLGMPILISSLIFYFASVWALGNMNIEDKPSK